MQAEPVPKKKMKKNRGWRKGRRGGKDRKRAEEAARKKAAKKQDALAEADECLEALGDPFDHMDFETKKELGIYHYFTILKEKGLELSDCACYAADMVKVSANTIINWVNGFKASKAVGTIYNHKYDEDNNSNNASTCSATAHVTCRE